jgi:hypothetical protein
MGDIKVKCTNHIHNIHYATHITLLASGIAYAVTIFLILLTGYRGEWPVFCALALWSFLPYLAMYFFYYYLHFPGNT